MTSDNHARPATARDYAAVQQAFEDTVAHGPTRRALMSRAGIVLAGAGAASTLAAVASPSAQASTTSGLDTQHADSILTVLASVEAFGVTFLSAAVRRAPGTPSEKFVPILKSANTAEYDHYRALRAIGARPLSTRIWIPDALFGGGGIRLFHSIEIEEDIEISAYLVGVTSFARARDASGARLCAEALGVEAEHRTVARSAQMMLSDNPRLIPDNRGFESYPYRTAMAALAAHEALGIRYGTKGRTPGAFYDFPGNPLDNGTGLPVTSTSPDSRTLPPRHHRSG